MNSFWGEMIMMLLTQIYGFVVLSLKDKRLVERKKKLFTYKCIIKESPMESYAKLQKSPTGVSDRDVSLDFANLFFQMMRKWYSKKKNIQLL